MSRGSSFLLVLCSVFFARAAEVRVAAKKFQNSLGQQNLQTVLMSIEERLRNLDSVYSMQYSPSVEGKLEHYGRKLDNVEAKLSRMEAVMRNELDKISENISSKNFKDDIAKDHVLRKIDSVYERINSRLVYVEIRLEMAERKLEDKLEILLSRLDKVEDDISTKDANAAMEFADVIAVLDDVKSSTGTIEGRIANLTVLINNTHHVLIQNQPSPNAFRDLRRLEEKLGGITSTNENFTAVLRDEIKEDFNSFANKVVDFHDSSWKTYDRLERGLRSVATVVNLTRYDVQNGFRSLTVQIGKKQASNMLSDSNKDVAFLENLDKKIDSNFESVMLAQNLFLESCYRLQKDESQLETKISEVLEKLIDTFEQKTALQPKDLKNLEQMIRNHDLNVRKSTSNLAGSVGALLEKTDANGRKTEESLSAFRNTIEELYVLVQSKFGVYDENKLDEVVSVLKDVRTHLLAIDAQIKQDAHRGVKDLKTILVQLRNKTGAAEFETFEEHVKQIYHILYSIELKLNRSYLDYYFDKYNVEAVAHRFGELLHEYLRNVTGRAILEAKTPVPEFVQKNSSSTEQGRTILEIFGQSNGSQEAGTAKGGRKLILDVFGGQNKQTVQNATATTNGTEAADDKEEEEERKLIAEIFDGGAVQNVTTTVPGDVDRTRLVLEIFGEKPDLNGTGPNRKRNCSVYDIDVRSGGDCLEQEEGEQNITLHPIYDIDIRFSGGDSSSETKSGAYPNDDADKKLEEDISTILSGDEIMTSYSEENATETLDYSQSNAELDYEHEYDDQLA